MAILMACADGNLTSASTWFLADSTSRLDSESTYQWLSTSYVLSSTFTPGAITIDGIAVKVSRRANVAGTNTISVALDQGGSTVTGTEVTIDSANVVEATWQATWLHFGWLFFKFSAPVTLLAATAYSVKAKTSANNQIALFRNATTGNWSRLLRTTTAPGSVSAGDDFVITGEFTSGQNYTARTVTMDSTAATDYGSGGSVALHAIALGRYGTLSFGTSASTSYVLRLSGHLYVQSGTLSIGTSGSPIPRTSTARLEFDCASDAQFALLCADTGTVNIFGESRTSGKNKAWTTLSADASVGATSLTVADDTGWLSGDEIGIAGTQAVGGRQQCEVRTLDGNAGATSMSVTAGTTYAHSGSAPPAGVNAEVVLLTRNVLITSVTSTNVTYCNFFGTTRMAWAAFRYVGSSTSYPGVNFSGDIEASYCVVRDAEGRGWYSNWIVTVTLVDCTAWYTSYGAMSVSYGNESLVSGSITGFVAIGNNTYAAIGIEVMSISLTGCRAACNSGQGIWVDGGGVNDNSSFNASTLDMSDLVTHNNGYSGIEIPGFANNLTLARPVTVRNAQWGIYFSGTMGMVNFVIEDPIAAGNSAGYGGIRLGQNADVNTLSGRIAGGTLTAVSGWAQSYGIWIGANSVPQFGTIDLLVDSCSFGVSADHGTADVGWSRSFPGYAGEITFRNCVLDSATKFNQAPLPRSDGWSAVRVAREGGVDGTHYWWYATGKGEYDASVYRTAAPSVKLTPNAATGRRHSTPPAHIVVDDGATKSVSVFVRKTANYNGNQPRLIVRCDPAMHDNSADVVLDTMSGDADQWEQLTGTTPTPLDNGVFEIVVDCDGTAGSVYVDDWNAS